MQADKPFDLFTAYSALSSAGLRLGQGMAIAGTRTLHVEEFPVPFSTRKAQCLVGGYHNAFLGGDLRESLQDKTSPLLTVMLLQQRVAEKREERFEESFESNLQALSQVLGQASKENTSVETRAFEAADLDFQAVFQDCERRLNEAVRRCSLVSATLGEIEQTRSSAQGEEDACNEDLCSMVVRLLVA